MAKVRSWVGLDVHAAMVLACVIDAESGEMRVHRLAGDQRGGRVLRLAARADQSRLRGWPDRLRAGAGAGSGRDRLRGRGAGQDRAPRRRTRSRPMSATRSGCVRLLMIDALHAVRVPTPSRKHCAIWSARVKTCEAT